MTLKKNLNIFQRLMVSADPINFNVAPPWVEFGFLDKVRSWLIKTQLSLLIWSSFLSLTMHYLSICVLSMFGSVSHSFDKIVEKRAERKKVELRKGFAINPPTL